MKKKSRVGSGSRKWLTRNKVFFEVFSFTFLGVASIFVAYLSWETSEKQVELSKLEQSPIINVSPEVENDSIFVINIYNEGKPAFEFLAMPMLLASVKNYQYIKDGDFAEHQFTINEHYVEVLRTGKTNGLLAKIPLRPESWIPLLQMRDSITNSEECEGCYLDYFDLLYVEFRNIAGNKIKKHYMITQSLSVFEISESRHDSLQMSFFKKAEKIPLNIFKNLSAHDLIKRIPLEGSVLYDYDLEHDHQN